MTEVHGFCDERFRALEDAFRSNLTSGIDKGASLAVTLHGEPVVDLWGGTRDYGMNEPWEADTLVRVWSTSKVVVMITVLMLVDRGLLDLDAPIARYWPEFAKNGKGAVTARQVLVHRSGLPGFGRSWSWDDAGDWDHMITMLEDAALWYEPGAVSCYHAHTFGYILGEVVRRLSGMPFEQFFREEIAEPLGADFHFALFAPHDRARVAVPWPPEQPPAIGSAMGVAVMGELATQAEAILPDYMATVMPSASGMTNGRALARIGAIVATGGELNGRRYLSPSIIDDAGREQSYAEDELLGWIRCGLGFGLDSAEFPAPTPTTMHWGGFGGSFLTMDPVSGISCGFAQNRMLVSDAWNHDTRRTAFWRILGEVSCDLG